MKGSVCNGRWVRILGSVGALGRVVTHEGRSLGAGPWANPPLLRPINLRTSMVQSPLCNK